MHKHITDRKVYNVKTKCLKLKLIKHENIDYGHVINVAAVIIISKFFYFAQCPEFFKLGGGATATAKLHQTNYSSTKPSAPLPLRNHMLEVMAT